MKYSSKLNGTGGFAPQHVLDFLALEGDTPPVAIAKVSTATPTFGPGTELHAMLQQMGFKIGGPGCGNGCQAWIDKMNRWGIQGCREHRQQIIDHLEKQADAAALAVKLKAGAIALAGGLPLSIGGLVDEAIHREEAK